MQRRQSPLRVVSASVELTQARAALLDPLFGSRQLDPHRVEFPAKLEAPATTPMALAQTLHLPRLLFRHGARLLDFGDLIASFRLLIGQLLDLLVEPSEAPLLALEGFCRLRQLVDLGARSSRRWTASWACFLSATASIDCRDSSSMLAFFAVSVSSSTALTLAARLFFLPSS